MIKYKKMTVWSAGRNAKTAKTNTVIYTILFILLCILHITTFICNPYDDKSIHITFKEHIFFGMMFICLLGWLTIFMFLAAISSFKDIKKNKLIPLYLYNIEEFAKIGEISEDKFILFSDKNGIVLAEKIYEDESNKFAFMAKYFYEFEKYYDKYAVEKIEIAQ